MSIQEVQKSLLEQIIQNSDDPAEVLYATHKLGQIGSRLTEARYAFDGYPLSVSSFNLTNREIFFDITSLYHGLAETSNILVNHFNKNVNDLFFITNELKRLSAAVTELSLISAENEYNTIYFTDTFINKDNIDTSTGTPCDILTKEGLAVLHINGSIQQKCEVVDIRGNGEPGNQHIIREATISSNKVQYYFLSDTLETDDISAITDGNPQTIYEYQALSLKDKVNLLDVNWTNDTDVLRLKVMLKIDPPQNINWISLTPFYPPENKKPLQVYSIKVSEDGINYTEVVSKDKLYPTINIVPQTFSSDKVFLENFSFKGTGVWNFAPKKTKFIEIILEQDEPFDELLGHIYYTLTDEDETFKTIIPEKDVPEYIVRSSIGKYIYNKNIIVKDIMPLKGSRLCIGIRDIAVFSYTFDTQSELVSKQFVSPKPIKAVSLIVNEEIPEEFLTDLTKRNDWIKYYISIDDINWHRISPMNHRPFANEQFPPKLITIGLDNTSGMTNIVNLKPSSNVYTVRLKAVFSRPDGDEYQMLTPILKDYTIRCIVE